MSKHFVTINLILFFCIFQNFGFAQSTFKDLENYIFIGEFQLADSLINTQLNKNTSNTNKATLFQLKGEILNLKGDVDEALKWWLKSNALRNKNYPKNDYHLAWNYALLSNYYYEKINTPLAQIYADSCFLLIQNLTIEQQKEIQIYRIWNILAQSYKQSADVGNLVEYNKKYGDVRKLYLKSLAFQRKNETSKHTLAKTLHLYANSFLDNCFVYQNKGLIKEVEFSSRNALINYDKAINMLTELYGNTHYEIATSLFLKGFLYHSIDNEGNKNSELAIKYFSESIFSYGKIDDLDLSKIPNKEGLLMCLKYYTQTLIEQYKRTKNIDDLIKAEKINNSATIVWEKIQSEFKSKNINKNLAIYQLMPQLETIAIETRLGKKEHQLDLNKIFIANQKLKYYDLARNSGSVTIPQTEVSINTIQLKLNTGELFLDFHTSIDNSAIYLTSINKKSAKLIEISFSEITPAKLMKEGIYSMDFTQFSENSLKLFQLIFPNGIAANKKLIVCADGTFNTIPFEALLVSNKNLYLNDYRKLDYLIHHLEIEYCLSASLFRTDQKNEIPKFKIDAFAPYNSSLKLSKLPFSEKLANEMLEKKYGKSYVGEKGIIGDFLRSTSPIIHLSSHGLIDKEYSTNSVLVLSDSLLTLERVYQCNLKTQLLVLNNCNSSNGKFLVGDGVDGFIRAFHAKGISNTLSNVWEVDDKQSNQLLGNFYNFLQIGNSTISALRSAKQEAIINAPNSNLAAPYYWAGQQLIGEGLVFEVENDNSKWFWLLGFVGLSILVFVFFKT